MTYCKPEVANLGDANVLIEYTTGKASPQFDGATPNATPAYDLDE
jgi:hypothetical protein